MDGQDRVKYKNETGAEKKCRPPAKRKKVIAWQPSRRDRLLLRLTRRHGPSAEQPNAGDESLAIRSWQDY